MTGAENHSTRAAERDLFRRSADGRAEGLAPSPAGIRREHAGRDRARMSRIPRAPRGSFRRLLRPRAVSASTYVQYACGRNGPASSDPAKISPAVAPRGTVGPPDPGCLPGIRLDSPSFPPAGNRPAAGGWRQADGGGPSLQPVKRQALCGLRAPDDRREGAVMEGPSSRRRPLVASRQPPVASPTRAVRVVRIGAGCVGHTPDLRSPSCRFLLRGRRHEGPGTTGLRRILDEDGVLSPDAACRLDIALAGDSAWLLRARERPDTGEGDRR